VRIGSHCERGAEGEQQYERGEDQADGLRPELLVRHERADLDIETSLTT